MNSSLQGGVHGSWLSLDIVSILTIFITCPWSSSAIRNFINAYSVDILLNYELTKFCNAILLFFQGTTTKSAPSLHVCFIRLGLESVTNGWSNNYSLSTVNKNSHLLVVTLITVSVMHLIRRLCVFPSQQRTTASHCFSLQKLLVMLNVLCQSFVTALQCLTRCLLM